MNRRVIESLIRSGAFSSVPGNRVQLLQVLDTCYEQGQCIQKSKNSKQVSFFDLVEDSNFSIGLAEVNLPKVEEFNQRDILAMEKEFLGLYVSGHPLEEFTQVIKSKTKNQIIDLSQKEDGERILIGGIITRVQKCN